jgi:hypothetical protein
MPRSMNWLEVYKCAVLTVIAVALVALYVKTPVPFTLENVRSNRVDRTDIPLVRVQGGSIDVD